MNTHQLILALTELVVSLLMCTSILFVTFRIVQKVILSKVKIGDNNVAFGIFLGSILFSVGYLVSASLAPLSSTYNILSKQNADLWSIIASMSFYLILFVSISWILAMIINFAGIYLYTMMTVRIEELEEISRNNIAIAIMTSAIVLVIAVFIKDQVSFLLESFVPYPELPNFHFPS